MSIVVASKFQGRLHIGLAASENSQVKKLGLGITSYNNFITRLFARIFGTSTEVEIAGKIRCVNKISYENHLKSIGIQIQNDVDIFAYDKLVKENKVNISNEILGSNFSHKRREFLFLKLIGNLRAGNTKKVIKLARKGAYTLRQCYVFHEELKKICSFYLTKKEAIDSWDTGEFLAVTPRKIAEAYNNKILSDFFLEFNNGQDILPSEFDKKSFIKVYEHYWGF